MRTAGSQSTHGPLQHFPTGSKLSHHARSPKEMTVTQSCSMCVHLLALSLSTQFYQWHSLKDAGIPCVVQKQEDRDVLGAAGLRWGY